MLQVYLAEDSCGWLDAAGDIHWDSDGPLSARLERCLQSIAGTRRRLWRRRLAVNVWMAGSLVRPFVLGAVSGLRGRQEVLSFARAQVAEATGWTEPCEIRVEGDIAAETALAVVMPAALRAQVERVISQAGLRLNALRPWWAGVLDQALAASQTEFDLLAVQDTTSLVVLTAQGDKWLMAEVFEHRSDAKQILGMVRRLASGHGIAPSRWAQFRLDRAAPFESQKIWPPALSEDASTP